MANNEKTGNYNENSDTKMSVKNNNNIQGESKLKLINFDLADIYFPLFVI